MTALLVLRGGAGLAMMQRRVEQPQGVEVGIETESNRGNGAAPSTKDVRSFLTTFAVLALSGTALLFNGWFSKTFVSPFTQALVSVSAAVGNVLGGNVQAHGDVVSFVGGPGAVRVANGCNAVEVCMLLAAAVVAYPASLKATAIGLALCLGSVQLMNLFRIISLLYLSRYAPEYFDMFHLYVWDVFIVLDGLLAFLTWIWLGRGARIELAAT